MDGKDKLFKTNLAKENWESKYKYGDETPIETQIRVARGLASVEKKEIRKEMEEKFLKTLVKFDEEGNAVGLKCTPGGRITANIGTEFKNATLFNCFINGPVTNAKLTYERKVPSTGQVVKCNIKTPETPDNLRNIMFTLLEQAETLKSEGGYGINFDFIRPRGTIISGIGLEHPGIVEYMKVWDQVATCIVKGNNDGYKDTLKNHLTKEDLSKITTKVKAMPRKGAMMGVLSVDHPDIEEFVRAKQEPGMLTKFNISVLVNDEFMNAVKNDTYYKLQFNGVVYKKVKAKELYDLIMESTYNRAEPGILFGDNMNRLNPLSYMGPVNATNPCGEIPGNPITSTTCLLGSVNLTQYVNEDRTFDFHQYETDISIFARMLDNVSDISNLPLDQYKWAVENLRQYGMGLNGFGSTLYMMGIPYNSEKAKEFAETLLISRENLTWITSALLAKEKGVFPGYKEEEFLNTEFYKNAKASYLWPKTIKLIEKYGVRNAKTTTNPPLGNTSVVCDMVSNGLEPVFMHEYQRTYIVKSWPEGLDTKNIKELFNHEKVGDANVWKGKFNGQNYYYEPHNRGLCIVEPVRDYGYQWVLDNYPNDIENGRKYLITTELLSVNDHVAMQEIFQKYCNQSVSKTINLPSSYPFENFKKLYMSGWKKGLIGLTTYRDGSMESVLSRVEEAKAQNRVVLEHVSMPDEFINGNTHKIRREGSKFYLNFSYLPNDTAKIWPIALFINCNSQYESIVCNRSAKVLMNLAIDSGIPEHLADNQHEKCKDDQPHTKLSKMISLNLRHGVEIVKIVESLQGVEGDNISSLLTAVRKFLSSNIEDGTKVEGQKCENCGAENSMVYSGGCVVCKDCGHSGCN